VPVGPPPVVPPRVVDAASLQKKNSVLHSHRPTHRAESMIVQHCTCIQSESARVE
jgi:hypothetical protein